MAFSPELPVPKQRCPVCNARLTAMVNMTEPVMARPDDFCICNSCGAVAKYDGRMRMRKLTPEEQDFATRSKLIVSASATIRARHGIS